MSDLSSANFSIRERTIILIRMHPSEPLRHIASLCVGAPWVGLSRAGSGCGPREPSSVSLPCVHAREVTQNSPHHRLSRSCISKRSKIVVERWQIPSFVPAWEPGNILRMLLSSTLRFSGILGHSGAYGATSQGGD